LGTKAAWRAGRLSAPRDVLRVFADTPLVRVPGKDGERLRKKRAGDGEKKSGGREKK
jgi:hypothetical protein